MISDTNSNIVRNLATASNTNNTHLTLIHKEMFSHCEIYTSGKDSWPQFTYWPTAARSSWATWMKNGQLVTVKGTGSSDVNAIR